MKMSANRIVAFSVKIMLTFCIIFTSCISQNKIKLIQEKTTKTPTTDFANSKLSTYRLQTGDQLYIEVYSVDPKTSKFFQTDFPDLMNPTYLFLKSYSVDEFGFIHFSFIEKMYVKGMTVAEVKDLLQKTLNDYFKESTVDIKLVNFEISVLGEVNSPGSFTVYREQINIFQAIGRAGGFKDFGNPKKVKLVRQVPSGSNVIELDLSNNKILESQYFYLQPNDVLYIEPLNAKSLAYSRFPYELLFVLFSTLAIVYTAFVK
jgi:polysaccharide export outer membrane protein